MFNCSHTLTPESVRSPKNVRIFCVSELAYANRTVKKIKAFCFIYFDFRLFYQLATANYKHIIPSIRAFVNTFFKKISERSHAPKFIKSQNLYSHIIQSVFFYNIFNHLNIFFCADGRCVFIFQKSHRNSEFSVHPADCKSLHRLQISNFSFLICFCSCFNIAITSKK